MKEYLDMGKNGQTTFKVSKTPIIENLIKQKRFDDALTEIDLILKSDYSDVNLNLKGIILDKLSRFSEAIECFSKALNINDAEDYHFNKANCYYDWAKVTFFPEGDYTKALNLIEEALNALPENHDPSEFYFLKAEILEALNELAEAQKAYLTAYKEFDRLKELEEQMDYLANTSDTLINIVGSSFYDFTPEKGLVVDLARDGENEHDPDAIAVLVDGEKIGYVANSEYTLISEVKSATDIQNMLQDNQKAKILFIYLGEYVIAKLIYI